MPCFTGVNRLRTVCVVALLILVVALAFLVRVDHPVFFLVALLSLAIFFHLRLKTIKNRILAEMWSRQEAERKRIAKDLHDETGQVLTALILNLQNMKSLVQEDPLVSERVDWLIRLTSDALSEMERLINNLRPGVLEDLGLVAALKWYITAYIEPTGIKVSWTIDGFDGRMPEDLESTLYRVLQEAVTNVLRHANASSIHIMLKRTPEQVVLMVEDDGQGFQLKGSRYGWGLKGIRERVECLGGEFNIRSRPRPENGTTVQIVIPVKNGGVGKVD